MAEEAASDMISWTERWLSGCRLAPHLAACGGDCERVLRLYEWNISLGQVLMREPHFVTTSFTPADRAIQ